MKKLLFLLLVVLISSCTVQENVQENTQENGNQDWANDGVSLARIKETGELACFGCGNAKCVDPLLDAIEWVNETGPVHCTLDFKVTSLEPSGDEVNQMYLDNEKYCEVDSDCVLRPNCCNSCYQDYVNIYHKEKLSSEECTTDFCVLDCPNFESFEAPSCVNNKCTRVNSNQQVCENSGGTWGANACTNTCNYKRPRDDGLVSGCGGSFTPGCDCGSNRCWNGNSCEDI